MSIEDNELIHKLKEGHEEAFEFIFKKYFSDLCNYAASIVKSADIAEEITEDLFLYLWENCPSLTVTSSLRAYLFRSVHNNCLKYLKHLQVEQRYKSHLHYTLLDEELNQPLSESYPVANLISQELEDIIEQAIEALPDRCRRIFCLQRFNNLTYPEIAEKLGVSVNTVKTQMARALVKLREELKDYLPTILLFILSSVIR